MMLKLKNRGMKILKIIHLLGACCWMGGAASMLVLNLATHSAESTAMLYGMNYASHMIDIWIVVLCGLYVCLGTGLIYGLFTPWGFIRFRWVICKWLVTCFCFISGWVYLGTWETSLMDIAKTMPSLHDCGYAVIRHKHFCLSILQISLLVFMMAISVIKPWKMNRRGSEHKLHNQNNPISMN